MIGEIVKFYPPCHSTCTCSDGGPFPYSGCQYGYYVWDENSKKQPQETTLVNGAKILVVDKWVRQSDVKYWREEYDPENS